MHEVIATPRLQPVLSDTYTLEQAITPPRNMPMTTARTVSWGMRSPW